MIYSYDNKKTLAKTLGISYNSFTKYLQKAIAEGLVIPQGEHLQAINLVKCIHLLGLSKKLWKYNNFCHDYTYEILSFKTVYERIITSIVTLNYEKQRHLIERNNILFSRSKDDSIKKAKQKILKGVARKAAKEGIETDKLLSYIQEKKIETIVSGKYHLSNLIEFSESSGLRWLNKLDEQKVIKRKVEVKFIKAYTTFKDYDFHIENMKSGRLLPVLGGFKNFQGSSISVLSAPAIKGKSRRSLKKGSNLKPKNNAE